MSRNKLDFRYTKRGTISRSLSGQRAISKRRGHSEPTYSFEELCEWAMSKPKFHILYDNWKRLDFQTNYRPSFDRKDDSIGYTMSNIQLMTWGENKAKADADQRSGKLKNGVNPQKPILQFSKDMELLGEYVSTMDGERQTGVKACGINLAANGKRKYAGKCIWIYKENYNGRK